MKEFILTEGSALGEDNKIDFPGKIAIITSHPSVNKNNFNTASLLSKKYGSENIVHVTWPENFINAQKEMTDIVAALAEDKEIRVLIVSPAISGSNAAIDKLKETRDDIFIVYSAIMEPYAEAASRANLLIMPNELEMASIMVKQAKKQGAKTFVHYSFPRHMALSMLSRKRDLIKENCSAEGILFIDAELPDPTGEAGFKNAQQAVLEDVAKLVAKYGDNTAFFCTNCALQAPLIKAVVDNHAIYPQGCCPSPYRGFPEALDIDSNKDLANLTHLISEISHMAAEKNMSDRLSSWPVSASRIAASIAAEYAIKWINREVTRTGIDDMVLEKCIKTYVVDVVGEGVEVAMSSYSENGVTYNNFKQILMSYLDF